MENRRRVTLDNAGLRYRARNYADSYTPRPHTPRFVADMMIVPQPKNSDITDEAIINKAKNLLLAQPTPTVDVPAPQVITRPSIVATHQEPRPLEELVSSIQGASRTQTFDKQLDQSIDLKPKDKFGFGFLQKINPKKVFNNTRSIVVSGVAVVLFFGGLVALLTSINNNHVVTMQVQALSEKAEENQGSTGESSGIGDISEDEVPEPAMRSYSVAPDYPKYIKVSKLGNRNSRILRMGVDAEGAIKAPRSIWDAGWYEGSSLPGDKVGASLILGHVSGPDTGGIFYNLYRLTDGDTIEITMGDDTVYIYTVVAKEEVPVGDINMNNYLISKNIDKPGLTLMTCAGEFNTATQQYESRLAVFAIRNN